jgi:hypothetical protein
VSLQQRRDRLSSYPAAEECLVATNVKSYNYAQ